MKVTYAGFANTLRYQGQELHPGDSLTVSDAEYARLTEAGHTLLKEGEQVEGWDGVRPLGQRTVVAETPTRTPYEASNGVQPYLPSERGKSAARAATSNAATDAAKTS